VDAQLLLVELVDVQPSRFAAAVRARLPQPRCDRHRNRVLAAGRDLEFAPLGNRALVDVPGDDQLRTRVDE